MTRPNLLVGITLTLLYGQGYGNTVWKCTSLKPDDHYMDKMCRDRCVPGKCESFCSCKMEEVIESCGKLDFASNNFVSINETAQPGTHIFTIPIRNKESWSYALVRSDDIDGSLWRDLQGYFNFKQFGDKYEMIVDKTPDLEYIYVKYSIKLKTLVFSMTCSSPGLPDETIDLPLLIRPINEYAPQFIGLPLKKSVAENTPIGTCVFSMENVTIDRDVNPSNKEISKFGLHNYVTGTLLVKTLDSQAYFMMPNLQKGFITVKENLDYEALNAIGSTKFLLNISAADIHGKVSFTVLEIDVTDVNDLPPEFRHPSCPLHIVRSRPCPVSYQTRIPPEYAGPLHHVIPGPIQARDMDAIGDNITLSLDKGPGESNENADKFTIDNTTGIVTLLSPFSKPTEVDLVVVAREESGQRRTTQAPFKVYVVEDKNGILTNGYDRLRNHTEGVSANRGDRKVDRSSDAINDKNIIFLIIIGILSALVLFLAILSISILCSTKKTKKTKVTPSHFHNNFTFSDNPSSFHPSLDGTSLDLTHDEFDMMSDKNAFYNSKSRSSIISKKHQTMERNNGLKQTASGYDFDHSESLKDHTYHNNHFRGNSRLQRNEKKKHNRQQSFLESDERLKYFNVINQENICCTPFGSSKLYNKQRLGRSISSVSKAYEKDSAPLHSRNSIRSMSSSLQQQSHSSNSGLIPEQIYKNSMRPGTTISRKSENPSNTELHKASKNASIQLHSRKSKTAKSKHPPLTSLPQNTTLIGDSDKVPSVVDRGEDGTQSVCFVQEQGDTIYNKDANRKQVNSATERRIRIPSGILIMKESNNNITNENICDDENDADDNESDIILDPNSVVSDDESSSCFDSLTPTTTPAPEYLNTRHRVSFHLEPSHSDVLSMMPMELSSSQSLIEIEHTKPDCQLLNNQPEGHPKNNTSATNHHQVNNLHVPEGCNAPTSRKQLYEPNAPVSDNMDMEDNDKLFDKVTTGNNPDRLNYSSSSVQHPIKPRRLPGLNIPGRKCTSEISSNVNGMYEEGKSQSESLLLDRRLENLRGVSEIDERTCNVLENDSELSSANNNVMSAIRKKKRRRRALSQKPPTEGNSAETEQNL